MKNANTARISNETRALCVMAKVERKTKARAPENASTIEGCTVEPSSRVYRILCK